MDYVSLSGHLLHAEDARIAPSDAGFLHGAGLYETMRVKNGRILRLADHHARLTASAEAFHIPFALAPGELAELTADLLEANGIHDARVRLTLTPGDLAAVTAEHPTPPITLLLTATPFVAYPASLYEKGMTAIISQYKQNPQSPLTGHKTLSHVDRFLALREAQAAGAGEALWFTPGNETLAEGSISNVFLVDKEGTLITPPLTVPRAGETGKGDPVRLCLPGVSRKLVLELAINENVLPHERAITIDDLLSAKEVFLTNAIMGVMPVTRLERHSIADEKPGEMTRKLAAAYGAKITEECHG